MHIDVLLVSYNQRVYVRQALESIFMQRVDAEVKVIVADDGSTDGTLELIKETAKTSPFEMIYLPDEGNQGVSKNYQRGFSVCNGDYIAILECDDYWLPNHLQQHVEFLQSHPECSMSMNEITSLQEETNEMCVDTMVRDDNATHIMVDLHKQIAEGNQLGNLSSCVIRGQYVRELPGDLFNMPIADWMLGVMMAQRGLIGILRGTTSVYRVKASGVWAGCNKWRQHLIKLNRADLYDKFQHGKYHREWKEFKHRCWLDVRRNWMHYMPKKLQKSWHKVKQK